MCAVKGVDYCQVTMTSEEPSRQTSSWSRVSLSLKDYLYFASMFLVVMFLPLLGVISCVAYALALLIIRIVPDRKEYGRFISYFDAWLEEEYVTCTPRSSLVVTLTVEGDILLEEVRSLFGKNVLDAETSLGEMRYPELKQYLTTFMGFRVWRNDSKFDMENHIIERSCNDNLLENVHEELLNQPYEKNQSPWEMILIRNATTENNNNNNNNDDGSQQSFVLAFRVHHVLADGKSVLKLFVECLGKKSLKTASPTSIQQEMGLVDRLKFHVMFPWNYLKHVMHCTYLLPQSHHHPWKVVQYWKDGNDVKACVAFSPRLPLADVKQVAKKNGVTSSAVVMSIVAGAIQKCGRDAHDNLGGKAVAIGYPLPKPDHPEVLANHVYMGFMKLPTDEKDPHKRLKLCNDEFLWVKNNQQGRYLDLVTVLGGTQLFPVTRLAVNQFTPTGITNIAGEEEGFSVGQGKCTDFRLTVGTLGGVAGVVFCAFSYKDGIRITVSAKDSVLEKKSVEKLAQDIGHELKLVVDNVNI